MRTTKTGIMAFATLGLLACTRASSPSQAEPSTRQESSASASPGPWNGGKPQAPLRIEGNLHGPIEPGVDVPLRVMVTPLGTCTRLHTEIRGLDGATVSGGEPREHAVCAEGREVVHEVTVRLAPGSTGMAVVFAELEADGQRQSRVSSILLEPRGGAAQSQKPPAATGKATVDAEGNRIIRMESEPR